MAWTTVEWACGHSGTMQLVGSHKSRDARVAYEAGKVCMACWLVDQWATKNDPRAQREDCYILAGDIARNKGQRIDDLPECSPTENKKDKTPEQPVELASEIYTELTKELNYEMNFKMELMKLNNNEIAVIENFIENCKKGRN